MFTLLARREEADEEEAILDAAPEPASPLS
jgi:hypothetical protein